MLKLWGCLRAMQNERVGAVSASAREILLGEPMDKRHERISPYSPDQRLSSWKSSLVLCQGQTGRNNT